MFLIKFFYFLKGYVIIEAKEKNIYDFFKLCNNQNINLYNIEKKDGFKFIVYKKNLKRAVSVARKSNIEIKNVDFVGLEQILKRLKSRAVFSVGAAIFVLFFSFSSNFLWTVEVSDECKINPEEVKSVLAQIGVKPGKMLRSLPDSITMKEKLINSFENVPWAWVYIKGVRAKVVVHKGTVAPVVIKDDEPCDIVAKRDGFLVSVSAKKGMKKVQASNAVKAGDVIISGKVEIDEDKPNYEVHADGDVLALTEYKKTGNYSLTREILNPTGKIKSVFLLNIFSKNIKFFSEPSFDDYIKHEENYSFLGFKIKKIVYSEAERKNESIPAEYMEEFAKRDLSAQIASELSPLASLKSENYTTEKNNDSITVTAEMSFIENIGTAVPR